MGIGQKPVRCLNAHASEAAIAALVQSLSEGQRIAYVTDAGTPGVSDPGQALCAAAIATGVVVSALPGPSAVTTAVAVSGLVDGPFVFLGFLPRKGGGRQEALSRIESSAEPTVLFESPKRLRATLQELSARAPERRVCVARELTKLHEQCLYGTLAELSAIEDPWRGEIVVVVAGRPSAGAAAQPLPAVALAALQVGIEAGASPSRLARSLADAAGLSRSRLYAHALSLAGEHEPPPSSGAEAQSPAPPSAGQEVR